MKVVIKSWMMALLAVSVLFSCTKTEMLPPPEQNHEHGQEPEEQKSVHFDFSVQVDGETYFPMDTTGEHLSVFVPYGTDLTQMKPLFNDKDFAVTVDGETQISGVTVRSFKSYKKGTVYKLVSTATGQERTYTVRVLDTKLPVVSVTTATPEEIADKETWRPAVIRVRYEDGHIQEMGATGIRGRGNWTWEKYPKKPYALKLEQKQEFLGMPAHKRWILLAQYRGFIGNPLAFEATRRAPALGWAPRGRFVELVLNGQFQGLYYLCEQIKIGKDRVSIAKMKTKDNQYPAYSGGYLLEYDELYDEQFKFMSERFNLPVQIKDPNDTLLDVQFGYIRDFINDMEAELRKIGTGQESHYGDYLDIDSFADYWMALEIVGNYEAWKPRSVKMYKGRDGIDSPPGTVCKLKAGPLWDQELFQVDLAFNSKNMYYFKYLFRDPVFVATVKERWPAYKSNLLGNEAYQGFVEYLEEMADLIKSSARRDLTYWGNSYFSLPGESSAVRFGFKDKVEWMDQEINKL